ncbi:Uncharacterised protein [Mycobacteroides abscessus]|nr:Uncharacterised protein [Mycobacteroides abscessus]
MDGGGDQACGWSTDRLAGRRCGDGLIDEMPGLLLVDVPGDRSDGGDAVLGVMGVVFMGFSFGDQ